jgi:hypothetical protein
MSILRSPLALEANRRILDALDRGPHPVAELPRHWPVTRALLEVCLADLVARGEVRLEGAGAARVAHRVAPVGEIRVSAPRAPARGRGRHAA